MLVLVSADAVVVVVAEEEGEEEGEKEERGEEGEGSAESNSALIGRSASVSGEAAPPSTAFNSQGRSTAAGAAADECEPNGDEA